MSLATPRFDVARHIVEPEAERLDEARAHFAAIVFTRDMPITSNRDLSCSSKTSAIKCAQGANESPRTHKRA